MKKLNAFFKEVDKYVAEQNKFINAIKKQKNITQSNIEILNGDIDVFDIFGVCYDSFERNFSLNQSNISLFINPFCGECHVCFSIADIMFSETFKDLNAAKKFIKILRNHKI